MKIKEDEELQESLQEEFDKEKNEKIKMWLSVIAIGIGIIGMIATTVPKNNNETKRTIKYNLSCLTASTKKPLSRCKITIVNRH